MHVLDIASGRYQTQNNQVKASPMIMVKFYWLQKTISVKERKST